MSHPLKKRKEKKRSNQCLMNNGVVRFVITILTYCIKDWKMLKERSNFFIYIYIYISIYIYIYILFLGKKRGNFLHLMSIWFKNWLFLPTYLYNLRQKTKSKLIFKKLLNTTPPFFGLERFIVRKFFRKIKEVEQWNRWKAKHYIVKEKKVKKIK